MPGHGRALRHRLRSRHPPRLVPRAGALVHLRRPHSDQRRELVHRPQLRFQRRHRGLRLHFRLYRSDRLCPHDAARRLGTRRRPRLPPRLAALCRPYPAVHGLRCPDHLGVDRPRHALVDRRDGADGPGREPLPGDPGGSPAAVPADQSRRPAALYRAVGGLPLRPAGGHPLAVRGDCRIAHPLCGDMPFQLELAGLPGGQGLVLQSARLAGGLLCRHGLRRAGAAASLARPVPLAALGSGRPLPAVRGLYRLVLAL